MNFILLPTYYQYVYTVKLFYLFTAHFIDFAVKILFNARIKSSFPVKSSIC